MFKDNLRKAVAGETNHGGFAITPEYKKFLIAKEKAECQLHAHLYKMECAKADRLVSDLELTEGVAMYLRELEVPDNGWGHHPEGPLHTMHIMGALKRKFGEEKFSEELATQQQQSGDV